MAPGPTIDELVLGDEPDGWIALGFTVVSGICDVGTVRLRLAGSEAGHGIVSWSLRGLESVELDGLVTSRSEAAPREPAARHPNGATGVDHVVALSGDFDRSAAALGEAGLKLRRVREIERPREGARAAGLLAEAPPPPIRQGFYRLGEALLELVEAPGSGPARFWGLVVVVEDLDVCAELMGKDLGRIRPAVQPGRRIATVRPTTGVGVALALISPAPPR
ncbi:MAG: glyoxalase [Solirubrobacteraceae bacterium]|nr:MAG: glyoxalase [Solirubrobacterales bacterium]